MTLKIPLKCLRTPGPEDHTLIITFIVLLALLLLQIIVTYNYYRLLKLFFTFILYVCEYMDTCLPQQACKISGQFERFDSVFLAGRFGGADSDHQAFVCLFLLLLLRQGFSV